MKNLVIKTDSNVIYVANGKVTLVRDNKTGRFVAIKKFSNIVNRLFITAKNADNALSNNKEFYYNTATKLALRSFKNTVKMATALLGDVLVYVRKNYAYTGFDFTILSFYA